MNTATQQQIEKISAIINHVQHGDEVEYWEDQCLKASDVIVSTSPLCDVLRDFNELFEIYESELDDGTEYVNYEVAQYQKGDTRGCFYGFNIDGGCVFIVC